jgi:lipocalin-like protein
VITVGQIGLNLSRDHRMRRIALLGLVAVALAACNNDSTAPNGSAIGSYTLVTVNGSSLPVNFGNGTVTSDVLTLSANGTYTDQTVYSGSGTQVEQGNWSISNNLITFNDQTDGIVYTGSLSGNVLTESFSVNGGGSITEVYQRQ